MNSLRFSLLLTIFIFSCGDGTNDIDKELKFTINTASNSRGLSSYLLPGSRDFSRIPQDPKNPLSAEKVHLGQLLFHEASFSTVGNFDKLKLTYTCATCHHVDAGFQAGRVQGIGDGGVGFGVRGEARRPDQLIEMSKIDVQPLRSPSALNIAYQTNILWNGQFGATALNAGTENLWPAGTPIAKNYLGFEGTETQAIAGLDVHRILITPEAAAATGYKQYFDLAFSELPESSRYSNITAGMAIAAYERILLANEAPFQRWLRGDEMAMTEQEKRGAILFFGKAECNSCHNGPSLAAMEFHALGMGDFTNSPDVLNFKKDDPSRLGRASFTKRSEDNYKFKVPQLYNLKDSPFYGHGGTFTSIEDVINYKNLAIQENSEVPASQLSPYFRPLKLTTEEVSDLVAFIANGLYDPKLRRYLPEKTLSGMCFPNNDPASQTDLGCK